MRSLVILLFLIPIGCGGKNEKKIYFPDGSLKEIRSYENGLRHGKYITFHANGDTARVYIYRKDSLKSMRVLVNNQTALFREYRDTLLQNGKEIFYHSDGSIKSVAEFKDGLAHGATLSYYKNGSNRTIMSYFKGEGVGEFEQYYPNGNLFLYSKEYSSGVLTYHDSTGTKKYDFLMKNGKSVDTLKVY